MNTEGPVPAAWTRCSVAPNALTVPHLARRRLRHSASPGDDARVATIWPEVLRTAGRTFHRPAEGSPPRRGIAAAMISFRHRTTYRVPRPLSISDPIRSASGSTTSSWMRRMPGCCASPCTASGSIRAGRICTAGEKSSPSNCASAGSVIVGHIAVRSRVSCPIASGLLEGSRLGFITRRGGRGRLGFNLQKNPSFLGE